MPADPRDPRTQVRALALWHSRRRAVEEVLEPLLEYGPVAVDRVVDRLPEICMLVDLEHEAFEAFAATAGDLADGPFPQVVSLYAVNAGEGRPST